MSDIIHSSAPTGATVSTSPMDLMLRAMERGMSLSEAQSALAAQKEWEAEEARKASVAAMLAFKADPPLILKKRQGQSEDENGQTVFWNYASIGDVCAEVIAAAAKFGFTSRWIPSVTPEGNQVITCEITHRQGHVQLTTLQGPRDETGGKTALQGDQSARSYLQRNSLLLGYGLAAIDEFDNDGAGAERPAGESDDVVNGWIVYVNDAPTLDALRKVRDEAGAAFSESSDVQGWARVKAAVHARETELKAHP